jgi:ribosomal protein S18 acetylase RimI-like enzyme
MPEWTARTADLDDPEQQAAISTLIQAYARDPMGGAGELPADVVSRLIPGLRKHPTSVVFLAYAGSEPVGVAVCFVGFSTFAGRPLLNVHDLAVAPGSRRRGVGRLLLDSAERHARAEGCCRLTLEVRIDNTAARSLYRSFGFGEPELGSGTEEMLFRSKVL